MTMMQDSGAAAAGPPHPRDLAHLARYFETELQGSVYDDLRSFRNALAPVQDELEDCGALVRLGRSLYVHLPTFWAAYLEAHRARSRRISTELLASIV